MSDNRTGTRLLPIYQAQVYASPYPLIRLGGKNDGGYVVADVSGFILISPGVGGSYRFELDYVRRYGRKAILVDGTLAVRQQRAVARASPYFTYMPKNVGPVETATETDLSHLLNSPDSWLQMDIEGAEWPWLYTKPDLSNVLQIIIELHDVHLYTDEKRGALEHLAESHRVVHIHGNNYGGCVDGRPKVLELTLLRKDLFGCLTVNRGPFPGPLDSPNNPRARDLAIETYSSSRANEQHAPKDFDTLLKGTLVTSMETKEGDKIREAHLLLRMDLLYGLDDAACAALSDFVRGRRWVLACEQNPSVFLAKLGEMGVFPDFCVTASPVEGSAACGGLFVLVRRFRDSPVNIYCPVHYDYPHGSLPILVYSWEKRDLCRLKYHHVQDEDFVFWGEEQRVAIAYKSRWKDNPVKPSRVRLLLVLNEVPQNVSGAAPFTFIPRFSNMLERHTRSRIRKSHRERTIETVFIGQLLNEHQKKMRLRGGDWSKAIQYFHLRPSDSEGHYAIPHKEYLEILSSSRFGLCLRGFGPKCFREIELLGLGTVLIVTPGVDVDGYHEPLREGVHYLRVRGPDDVAGAVKSIGPERWEAMSRECTEWWDRNASIEGSFGLAKKIIDL